MHNDKNKWSCPASYFNGFENAYDDILKEGRDVENINNLEFFLKIMCSGEAYFVKASKSGGTIFGTIKWKNRINKII